MEEMSFDKWVNERTKLNNEIIVPAYRQFCKENSLAFHFWDELPKEQFNPEIALEELMLHHEAMNCFNNLKPKFVLFNNKIYTFHFTVWGGDFEFMEWEIEDFLNQAHEQVNRVGGLEKQLQAAFSILGVMSVILIIVLTVLTSIFFADKFGLFFDLGIVIGTVSIFSLFFFIIKKYFSDPLKKYSSEINQFKLRLETLKQKFNHPLKKK